jgi:hypothetical protein
MTIGVALAVLSTIIGLSAKPAGADVQSDQAEITALGSRIAQDGAQVQQLVNGYNQAQTHQAVVAAELVVARTHLDADRQAEARAQGSLRRLALNSYMSGDPDNATLTMFDTSASISVETEQEYTQVASTGLNNAIDAVMLDVQRTQAAASQLHAAQSASQASVVQLTAARQAAQAALDHDNALLSQVQGNLQSLLVAAAQQRAAAQQAQEEAMAAAQERAAAQAAAQAAAAHGAGSPPGPSHPVSVTFTPTPGSYVNPLRAISALSPERVDQGVDYSGYGPIYALGEGVVLSTSNGGWPGGTYITYRLTDGPASGLVVYAAEDIDPQVTVGQTVTPATVLGTVYEGPSGIETGWANASGDGTTMANDAGQFSGANSTAFGANFSQLLASLGAPPGVPQNDPPTGSLPAGWPNW